MAKRKVIKKTTKEDKAKHTATLRALKSVAKEVNAMLDKAAKSDDRAFDLRLSAACHLAKARETCKTDGLKFQEWCEANVQTSYKEVKRLALVGAADDPKLALEDLRAKTLARVRKSRENARATAAPTSAGRVTSATTAGQQPALSAYTDTLGRVAALTDKERVKIATEVAQGEGLSVVTQAVAKKALTAKEVDITLAAVKIDVKRLAAVERRKLLRWLTGLVEEDAKQAGVSAEEGIGDLPKNLDRSGELAKGKTKRGRIVRRGAKA